MRNDAYRRHNNNNISVVVPSRNRKALLKDTIYSLLKQDCSIDAIIISDNHSNPPINSIDFEESQDSIIEVIRPKAPLLIVDHFNWCKQYVKDGYIVLLADDDIISSDYISSLEYSLSKTPGADIAIGNVARMSFSGEVYYHYDRQKKYKVQSTVNWSLEQKAIHYLRYGHKEEWAWTIIYGLYKATALNSHSFSKRLNDPGALFVCDVMLKNNIVYNKNHGIVFKRDGGESNTQTKLEFSSMLVVPWQTLKSAWLITSLIVQKLKMEKQLSFNLLLTLALFWVRNIGKSLLLAGWCVIRSITPPRWLNNVRPKLRRLVGG